MFGTFFFLYIELFLPSFEFDVLLPSFTEISLQMTKKRTDPSCFFFFFFVDFLRSTRSSTHTHTLIYRLKPPLGVGLGAKSLPLPFLVFIGGGAGGLSPSPFSFFLVFIATRRWWRSTEYPRPFPPFIYFFFWFNFFDDFGRSPDEDGRPENAAAEDDLDEKAVRAGADLLDQPPPPTTTTPTPTTLPDAEGQQQATSLAAQNQELKAQLHRLGLELMQARQTVTCSCSATTVRCKNPVKPSQTWLNPMKTPKPWMKPCKT